MGEEESIQEKWFKAGSMETKRDSVKFYSVSAPSYEELYGIEQQAKYEAVLGALGDAPLGSVLDVGCGTGVFLLEISTRTTLLVGIDVSREMLVRAREGERHQAHLIRCDADFLPFLGGVFDSVFAFTLIQNMPDPSLTLLEMARVSKPEGRMVVTSPVGSQQKIDIFKLSEGAHLSCLELKKGSSKDRLFVCRKRGAS